MNATQKKRKGHLMLPVLVIPVPIVQSLSQECYQYTTSVEFNEWFNGAQM